MSDLEQTLYNPGSICEAGQEAIADCTHGICILPRKRVSQSERESCERVSL